MRAMRDVIDPLCGLKVVYLLMDVGFAAWVLKAVRTWAYMQACRSVAGRRIDAIESSWERRGVDVISEEELLLMMHERPRLNSGD